MESKETKKGKSSLKRIKKTLSWSALSRSSRDAMNRSKSIDHQIEAEKEKKQKEVLLLILGGACSGKSTFVKQLRIHYGDGFPDDERLKYRNQVYDNVANAANKVLENMKLLQIPFTDTLLQQQAADFQRRNPLVNIKDLFKDMSESEDLESPKEPKGANGLLAMACSELTKRFTYLNLKCNGLTKTDQRLLLTLSDDPGYQKCYTQRASYQGNLALTPQEIYFLSQLRIILGDEYLPSQQDILFIRKPTLGVIEHMFQIDNLNYRVIDVAGQKSQRKKWIHVFENITVVVYFVSLSGFDEPLEEDETINSMADSLTTFREVSHNLYLEKTDFLLFLNKHDLFVEKLKTVQLSSHFKDFKGENKPEVCVKYIRDLFHQHRPCHKQVYTHVSCATDVTMMKETLSKVLDIVHEVNLRKSGGVL